MAAAVLVGGAAGNVGSATVQALHAAGARVCALVRNPDADRARALAALDGVTVVKGDYADKASVAAAFRASGAQRCMLTCSNYDGQLEGERNFIDAAREAGAVQLVKLGTWGDAKYTCADSPIAWGRWHHAAEAHLADKGPRNWTVIRPNWYQQNLPTLSAGVKAAGVVQNANGDGAARMIDTRDIGAAAAALLLCADPEKHHAAKYTLSGPEPVSFPDVAEMLSRQLGKQVRCVPTAPAAYAEQLKGFGLPAWKAESLGNGCAFFAGGSFLAETSPALAAVYTPKRAVSSFLAEHVAAFRSADM